MNKLSLICTGILVAAIVVGCKNKEDQVVGKWNGPGGTSVTINKDKTFTQAGMVAASGKWTFSGSKVTLKTETLAGQPADNVIQIASKSLKPDDIKKLKEMIAGTDLTLSDDGKSLAQKAPNGTTVTLTKEESK